MSRRNMALPEGWYPHDREGIEEFIRLWEKEAGPLSGEGYCAGIVPHAGWFFSGKDAWSVIRNIPRNADRVIIAGGHLSPGHPILAWQEDSYETPRGDLKRADDLFREFCTDAMEDSSQDNTVEVQLPLLASRNPDIRVLGMRLPPDETAFQWGVRVGEFCLEQGITAFFLGSTDLTHYGYSYGNLNYADKRDPLAEAKKQDGFLLEALKTGDHHKAIDSVSRWQTACSLGGALGAVGFAAAHKRVPGRILSLTSSSDKIRDSSNFVNYGSLLF